MQETLLDSVGVVLGYFHISLFCELCFYILSLDFPELLAMIILVVILCWYKILRWTSPTNAARAWDAGKRSRGWKNGSHDRRGVRGNWRKVWHGVMVATDHSRISSTLQRSFVGLMRVLCMEVEILHGNVHFLVIASFI